MYDAGADVIAICADPDGLNVLVNDLLPRLASPEGDRSRDVVLMRALTNRQQSVVPELSSGDVAGSTIPESLRERVTASGKQQQEFVRVRYSGSDTTKPGVAIGSTVTLPVAGTYELYFVFPMDHNEFSRTGVIGNPLTATAEKGEEALEVLRSASKALHVPVSEVAQRLISTVARPRQN